jgi:cell division protein FtsQ
MADPVTEAAARRSRRASARRQWGRRWLRWKPVLAVVVLVVAVVGGVWLVWFSQALAVTDVRVTGTDDLPSAEVLDAAGVTDGTPLARVDVDSVRTRVQAIADVREATVTREWPHTVVIEVAEREPVAVVDIGGRLRALDQEGVVFDSYRSAPGDLPRVTTQSGAGREALEEAAAVVSALPDDLATRVDHVEVATVDQVSLALRDGRTVVWGSADDSDLKAEVLVAMLGEAAPPAGADGPADIDVSVPGRPSFLP